MLAQLINFITLFSETYLKNFIFLLPLYTTSKILSTYTLHKDFQPKDISKVSIPLELKKKYTKVEIEQISSEKIREAVFEFADVLEKEFPQDALINFYNNVNEVKIRRNNLLFLIGVYGVYSSKSNKINCGLLSSIYHELFHMASSAFNSESNICYGGFNQSHLNLDSKFNIGKGINEGYTELLSHRYFGKKHKIKPTYEFEVVVVEKLEKIVGEEEMKRLYLNANLLGLIENLKQYASEEDIVNFITGVDLIINHEYESFLLSNNKIKASLTNIYNFLLKAYITKLKQQVVTGIITINEFLEQSNKYIKSLGTSVKIGNHNYEYLTIDSLLDNLEKISDIPQIYPNNECISSSYKNNL